MLKDKPLIIITGASAQTLEITVAIITLLFIHPICAHHSINKLKDNL